MEIISSLQSLSDRHLARAPDAVWQAGMLRVGRDEELAGEGGETGNVYVTTFLIPKIQIVWSVRVGLPKETAFNAVT